MFLQDRRSSKAPSKLIKVAGVNFEYAKCFSPLFAVVFGWNKRNIYISVTGGSTFECILRIDLRLDLVTGIPLELKVRQYLSNLNRRLKPSGLLGT